MKNEFERMVNAFKSFFSLFHQTLLLLPFTPYGRLETIVHCLMLTATFIPLAYAMLFVSLLFVPSHPVVAFFVILTFLIFLYIPIFLRIFMNRFADMQQYFNDDKTLFFTPKRALGFIALTLVCVLFLIEIEIDHLMTISSSNTTQLFHNSYSTINALAIASCAFSFFILQSASVFPSKTLNIFENIDYSDKRKEFLLFFLCLGIILIFFMFIASIDGFKMYLMHSLPPHRIIIAISLLVLALFLVKNGLIRLIFIFIALSVSTTFGFYSFSMKDQLLYFAFCVALLALKKNFLFTAFILGSLTLFNQPKYQGIFLCIYLIFLFDFFNFKNKKSFIYTLIISFAISLFYLYITPLLKLPIPKVFASIPEYLFLLLTTLLSSVFIYLNTKFKNQSLLQIFIILTLCILGRTISQTWNLVFFANYFLILFVIILWIISHQTNLSSAYKLGICSSFFILCYVEFDSASKTFIVTYAIMTLTCLFITYLSCKIKSPLKPLLLVISLYILSLNAMILFDLIDFNYQKSWDIFPLLIILYIFYQYKNHFTSNLNLIYKD